MNNERLTAYDNFIISKNKFIPQTNVSDRMDTEDAETFSPSYAKYLKEQLRRTSPSEEKVMTQEEFESRDEDAERKSRMWKALGGKPETAPARSAAGNVQFKKFGKILLCAYVIIMLCLALIVIVKTTAGDNTDTAGASEAPATVNSSGIEMMEDEESEENGNWFDNLCDSLK